MVDENGGIARPSEGVDLIVADVLTNMLNGITSGDVTQGVTGGDVSQGVTGGDVTQGVTGGDVTQGVTGGDVTQGLGYMKVKNFSAPIVNWGVEVDQVERGDLALAFMELLPPIGAGGSTLLKRGGPLLDEALALAGAVAWLVVANNCHNGNCHMIAA